MQRFVRRRLFETAITLVGLTFFFFAMTYFLPGDPVRARFGVGPVDWDRYRQLRDLYHLDDGLWQRYVLYMSDLIHLNLGRSFYGGSVGRRIAEAIPTSLGMLGFAMGAQVVIGLLLGWIGSSRKLSVPRLVANFITMLLVAVPVFVMAYVGQAIFAHELRWVPVTGLGTGWKSYAVPAAVLALAMAAIMARVARAELQENRRALFAQVAKAKGLRRWRIMGLHVMRPSLTPVIHLWAASAGQLVAGLIVVETVFGIPGLGGIVYQAIRGRDQPVIMGVLIVVSVVVLLATFVADLVSAIIDPRIRTD